jgi:hypothetical protein
VLTAQLQEDRVKPYEKRIIAEAQAIGLDVDASHVTGNPEILWWIRCQTKAILNAPETARAAMVARVNDGWSVVTL